MAVFLFDCFQIYCLWTTAQDLSTVLDAQKRGARALNAVECHKICCWLLYWSLLFVFTLAIESVRRTFPRYLHWLEELACALFVFIVYRRTEDFLVAFPDLFAVATRVLKNVRERLSALQLHVTVLNAAGSAYRWLRSGAPILLRDTTNAQGKKII